MPLSKSPIADTSTTGFGTTEAWNVADGFMKLKVLKFLIDADRYEIIAQYGLEAMDNPMFPPDLITPRRIEGIFRLKDILKMIISNTTFALKKKDREGIEKLRHRVIMVEDVIEGVHADEVDDRAGTRNTVINENHFKLCLKNLQAVKEELNFLLNNAGLIFRQSDEMDIDQMMKDIVESG